MQLKRRKEKKQKRTLSRRLQIVRSSRPHRRQWSHFRRAIGFVWATAVDVVAIADDDDDVAVVENDDDSAPNFSAHTAVAPASIES